MQANETLEYGVEYITPAGELRSEWGWIKDPREFIDKDGEIQIGKREWVQVVRVMSRPEVQVTTLWEAGS